MTNEMVGEVWNGQRNSVMPFGETVADAYGLVFFLKSDGKLYRARADAAETARGPLFLCRAASVTANGYGDVLAMGLASKSTWNWTVGGELYLSPTTLGAMTQTKPDPATQIVRALGHAVSATTISFRPFTAAQENAFALTDIAGSQGSLILKGATEWVATPASALPNHPLVPDLLNRVVYETDEAGNTLEIHQVYIPLFYGAGLPDANLNGVLFGGFWIDKYLACQPDASNVSRGSVSPNNPGTNGAASKPHVVPWTDINWSNARTAIENRGGENNHKSGTCTALAEASASAFYVSDVTHLIGKRIYVTQAGVKYVRRVVRTGGDTTADPNAAKRVELYPALPAPITDDDTYEILHYYLPGGYEWASLYAWAYMNLYRHGLGWPKGNTNWGKFHGDPRARAYEGLPDPVQPGYSGNAISRTLTGSGPLSWSLNGKESGIWDLVGNCWEWCDLLVGTTADNTIDAEYPGAGTKLPSADGYLASLYAPAPEGEYSLGAEVFVPTTLGSSNANYDGARYWQTTGQRAVRRGGAFLNGAYCSLASLYLNDAPSNVNTFIGFRGVC